jgi:N-glycosylase/DNA lyase
MAKLDSLIIENYELLKPKIKQRLSDFKNVKKQNYFYELCYCLCTPQSQAENALVVQKKLERSDFFNKRFDPTNILRQRENYIRFHNQKAIRLLQAIDDFDNVLKTLESDSDQYEKRNLIKEIVNGFGMKESSHFLRNIGYEGLAILDRHILKHLHLCGLYDSVPKISTKKQYLAIEYDFLDFSKHLGIPIDELDLLFWSYETGEILK